MSDDQSTADPPVEPTDSGAPEGAGDVAAKPVWTAGRIILVLLAIAMLGVTIGVYLKNNTIDPDLIVPHKLAALVVFAIVGGIGYRLSGKLGEKLMVVIAALSAIAVVLMYVSSNYELDPKQIHMGYLASQGIIALVFVLAGLCIFGGWIYFGFFQKHESSSPVAD